MTSTGRPSGFWSLLCEADREAVRAVSAVAAFPAGTTILREGTKTNHVYVILSGRVKIILWGRGGYGAVLALRGPGDIIGELAAVDDSPHFATATCLDRVTAHPIRDRDFRELLSSRPAIAHAVLTNVTTRLRSADHNRVERVDRPVPARLAALLLELVERHGVRSGTGVLISLPISQTDLAGLITASREAVTKVLHEWRLTGVISTGRRRIVVHRPDALRAVADR